MGSVASLYTPAHVGLNALPLGRASCRTSDGMAARTTNTLSDETEREA